MQRCQSGCSSHLTTKVTPPHARHISSSPTFVRTEPLGSKCQSCVPSTMSNSHMNGFASPQSKFCHVPRLWTSGSYHHSDWPTVSLLTCGKLKCDVDAAASYSVSSVKR